MQRLSGPIAVEFLLILMASAVLAGVKGEKEWSKWCSRCRRRMVWRSSGSWVCGLMEVNCLVKYLAMAEGLVQVLVLPLGLVKVMGWFGGVRVRVPDMALIMVQKPRRLSL